MNFLHLSLLAGLGAMAIPVALHLLSRRQPKLVPFPALRFVKQMVVQQRGSWQLRHFLLLCLRVAMFGAMAIALARPRVHSAMVTTALGLGLVVAGAIFASLVALVAAVTRRGVSVWLPAAIIAVALWLGSAIWTGVSVSQGPVVPSSDQTAPVAAAIVIDNGPSLDYRAENAKRFVVAKEMASWILGKLPLDSRVGVLTNAPLGSLSLDPSSAKGQVDILQPQALHVDLPARIRTAIELVLASDLERKEVYVVTDLISSSWSTAEASLSELLQEHAKKVLVQIIDVGAARSTNWRLGDLENDSQSVPEGGDAAWQVSVTRTLQTPGATASVELHQEQIDSRLPIISNGKLQLPPTRIVDRQLVDLTQASDAQVTLSARGLMPGTHNFQIKLTVADPLEIDNTRYASVVCAAQQPVLVVADDADAARFLKLALSPGSAAERSEQSPAPSSDAGNSSNVAKDAVSSASVTNQVESAETQQVRYNQLAQVAIDRYGVVCLNDPSSMPPSTVAMLETFVKQGGGLFIMLGPALGGPQEANDSPVKTLLPGKLARVARRPLSDSSLFLVPVATTHPLFHIFGSVAADVPWNVYPLHRVWELESLNSEAQVLMTTSDRALPALVLERRGTGQILTLVTPLPSAPGADTWNDLTAGSDPWPAFGLLLGAARLLSGQTESRYNFTAGQSVTLANDPKVYPTFYELFAPNGETRRIQSSDGVLVLGTLDQAGTYRMRGLQGSSLSRGVSVNTPSKDTLLDRLEGKDLDNLLGAGNYRFARQKSEVESSVGQARYGRELFPVLMACVAGLFLAEQAMSNRFYKLRLAPAKAKA